MAFGLDTGKVNVEREIELAVAGVEVVVEAVSLSVFLPLVGKAAVHVACADADGYVEPGRELAVLFIGHKRAEVGRSPDGHGIVVLEEGGGVGATEQLFGALAEGVVVLAAIRGDGRIGVGERVGGDFEHDALLLPDEFLGNKDGCAEGIVGHIGDGEAPFFGEGVEHFDGSLVEHTQRSA